MQKRRLVALVGAAILAGVVTDHTSAAVFAELLRASAHGGDRVGAEVDAWTATHHPPLYLVPERSSSTFTTTRGVPRRPPYVRLRHIEWNPASNGRAIIRIRVPALKPDWYRLVIYCESCLSGPVGSVIGSVNSVRVR
jgi:hypothetical protein